MIMAEISTSGKTPLTPDIDFLGFALAQKPMLEIPEEGTSILFFCKDCQKITEVERMKNQLRFRCKVCKGDRISFGTSKSVASFYHIKS